MPFHAPTRPHWLIAALSFMVALLTGCGPQGDSTPAVSVLGIISQYSLTGRPISTLQVKATSKDGKTLSYAATGLPPGVSIDVTSGAVTGTATTVGTYPVVVTVSTESGKSSRTFTWNVYADALVVTRSGSEIRLAAFDTRTATTGWCFKAYDPASASTLSTPDSSDACWQPSIAKNVPQQLPLPVYAMWTRDGNGNVSAPITGPCSFTLMSAALASALPVVCMVTSVGEIAVELNTISAPATSNNFLQLVQSGFYDLTILHRILKQAGTLPNLTANYPAVVEGGVYTALTSGAKFAPNSPFQYEATGLTNRTGTIGLASVYDAAYPGYVVGGRFYVNFADNPCLDIGGTGCIDAASAPSDPRGQSVFGRVIHGASTLQAIQAVSVSSKPNGEPSTPDTPPMVYLAILAKQ